MFTSGGDGGDFGRFLRQGGVDATWENRRFIARNFLLDEAVSDDRVASYYRGSPHLRFMDFNEWNSHHNSYVDVAVYRPRPALGVPREVDVASDIWPETFRTGLAFRDFGLVDEALLLIRVEDATRIARRSGERTEQIVEWATGVEQNSITPEAQRDFTAALDIWQESLDLRPMYASFWEDLKDVFPSGYHWPDALRDRLGLYHYDPNAAGGPIPMVVFRYPVRIVPRRRGEVSVRAIVRPVVLDGRFAEAFCPAPGGSLDGCAVDLSARLEQPWREVVHATARLQAEHVFHVGEVKAMVPDDLTEARMAHLTWLRIDWPTFANGTDADLFG
jgi:tetratricopeptide (TPR) repeat protein